MILSQKQTQQQVLSPALKQSLHILQLPLTSLQEHLNDISLENPMLELTPSDPEVPNWREDLSGRKFERAVSQHSRDDAPLEPHDEHELQETFVSHLQQQLPQIARHLPERYLPMCAFIIESLDRRGYLDEPIDLLAASMGVSVEDATQALYAVQTLSPVGTGARSLEECLILQLAEGKDFNRYTLAIVREHLLLLARNDIPGLARALKLSQDEARAYGKVIRALNPIPSNGFRAHQDSNHPIIPDAVVEVEDGELIIHYNNTAIPRVAVNPEYQSMLDRAEDPGVQEYLKQHLQQINKLRQDLDKRESTLLRLIRYILTVQHDYVLGAAEAPAPLSVQEIAEELSLHPSTISRAIRDKYITVDGHTIPLKNLLSAHIGKGIPMSRAMLRLCMERLIDAEDKSHPLSDESLAAALSAMDIHISRRTVAAYREEFDIPPASRRRIR